MKRAAPLDLDLMRAKLRTDLETGQCFWIDASKNHANLNGKEAGAKRLGRGEKLYWVIKIGGIARKRSQIVFAVANGRWSDMQVVHKNGDSLDDRANNLVELLHHGSSPKSPIQPGDRFGLLVVQQSAGNAKDSHRRWLCKCDCGGERVVQSNNLQSAKNPSCGCVSKIPGQIAATKHGHHGTATYRSWQAASQRCNNPSSKDYDNYGCRGIKMCDDWINSFEQFLSHMGTRPEGTSLGRIDNDGNYEPGNCRWETMAEQSLNKRNSTFVPWGGKSTHITFVAKELGITNGAAHQRKNRGKLYAFS